MQCRASHDRCGLVILGRLVSDINPAGFNWIVCFQRAPDFDVISMPVTQGLYTGHYICEMSGHGPMKRSRTEVDLLGWSGAASTCRVLQAPLK